MKIYFFLSILLVNLIFSDEYDVNAKTEENKNTILTVYSNNQSYNFHKYKDSLWFYDEDFSREILDNGYDYAITYIKNKNILDDRKLFLQLMKQNEYYFRFASPRLHKDKELIKIAISGLHGGAKNFEFVDDSLKSDRNYVLSLIQDGYHIYPYIHKKFYSDREITLLSVKQFGIHLKNASSELKDDRKIVLEAVRENGNALQYASNRLKKDEYLVLKALSHKYTRALEYADISLRKKREVVLYAVKMDGKSLQYASKDLKSNKDVVWEAIKQDSTALYYADKSIMKEKDIVLYYIKQINRQSVLNYHLVLKRVDISLLNNKEVVSNAVIKNGMFLEYASSRLKKNRKIVLQAVHENGLALQFADIILLHDTDILVAALKNNINSHQYIPYDMKKNQKISMLLNGKNANASIINKIKRKSKPKAWEMYNVADTIEALYGKNKTIQNSNKVHVKLPDFIVHSSPIKVDVNTALDVKSIAILQNVPNERCLTTLFYPTSGTTGFFVPIKSVNQPNTYHPHGIKLIVVTQTKDNQIYINEVLVNEAACDQGYGYSYQLQELASHLNENTNIGKIKYKVDKNKIGYTKFIIKHPMISYRDAKVLNKKVNFISHIEGHVKNKKVFDLYTSEYTARNPIFNIKFKDVEIGSILKISYTDIHGNTKSKERKSRRYNKN